MSNFIHLSLDTSLTGLNCTIRSGNSMYNVYEVCNFDAESTRMITGNSFRLWIAFGMIVFLVPSYIPFTYAQNLTSQLTQWFVPLDIGKQLKIQCFNGSFVEFVSDCNAPRMCKSLSLLRNDTLVCSPNSQFEKNGDQLIFP